MTSTVYASISAPPMEDSMEVSSSPAGIQYDDDIDIDFGDYGSGVHIGDDERMLEDGEMARPATATDDMMDDDDGTATALTVEEVMHDGPENEGLLQHELADEELIDYDDDDTFQELAQPASDDHTIQPAESSDNAPDQKIRKTSLVNEDSKEDTHVQQPESASLSEIAEAAIVEPAEQPEILGTHTSTQPKAESGGSTVADAQHTSVTKEDAVANAEKDVENDAEETSLEEATADRRASEDLEGLKASLEIPDGFNTSLEYTNDGPPTPTDTGLHPVTVKFEGYEMPLFKSRAQPDGLLKDDNLASMSFADLLNSVRQRISSKIGEIISEEQELSLLFDRLGLLLSESSRSASATSLNDVLEVFLQLHHNDGIEDVPPLTILLSRQLKFTSSLNLLKHAASQGQGISSFSFLDSEDAEDADQDDKEDGIANGESSLVRKDMKGQARVESQDFAENAHFYDGDDEQQQEFRDNAQEVVHDETDDYQKDENHDEQYEDYDENEDYPDPDDYEQHEYEGQYQEDLAPENYGDADNTEPGKAAGDANTEAVETAEHTVISESAGTLNDTTGEYDLDDVIDWEDEDLTTHVSETYADDPNEEISNLFENGEDGHPQEGTPEFPRSDDVPASNATTNAKADHTDVYEVQPAKTPDAHDFYQDNYADHTGEDAEDEGAEDEGAEDEGAEDEGAEYTDEAGEDLAQYEELDHTQADNVDYDEDGEVQPGEEEEQFHTALDLFDNDDLEQPATGDESTEIVQPVGGDDVSEHHFEFDDDADFGDHPDAAPAGTSNSPLGKRSFEEHADEDELDLDARDSKKARSD